MKKASELFHTTGSGSRIIFCLAVYLSLTLLISLFSVQSVWAAGGTPLDAPTDLTVTDRTNFTITLTWTDNSNSESGYRVEMSLDDGKTYITVADLPPNTTSYTVLHLTNGSDYLFRVKALGDSVNNLDSDYSKVIIAAPLPFEMKAGSAAPTDLKAMAVSTSQIELAWVDKFGQGLRFAIERKTGSEDFKMIATVRENTFSYSDYGLNEGTTYTYRVRTEGTRFYRSSPYSNEALATTLTKTAEAPQYKAPGDLIAQAMSKSQINLYWYDNTMGKAHYTIERKTGDEPFTAIATVPNSESYADNNLKPGTTYTYRVKASRSNDSELTDSKPSNEASATTFQEIGANPPHDEEKPAAASTVLRFYPGESQYFVNDEARTMDSQPAILEGRTFLPVAYAAVPLNIEIGWNEVEKEVTLKRRDTVINLWIDRSTARVNGTEVYIDANNHEVTPRIIDGRTMLPIGFIALNFKCMIDWEPSAREVKITYPNS